jgi:hypothetical protein
LESWKGTLPTSYKVSSCEEKEICKLAKRQEANLRSHIYDNSYVRWTIDIYCTKKLFKWARKRLGKKKKK